MSIATEPLTRISDEYDGPLRVLLVTQSSAGGAGRHFLDIAQALSARGVHVRGIYAPSQPDGQFRQRLAAGGLPPMYQLDMRRAIHPRDAADFWKLLQLIRRLGPVDLIHGHSSKGGTFARLAARWLRVPSVYTPHAMVTLDPTLVAWQRGLYKQIERWLARMTQAIIAVSDDEADHIRSLGIDSRKLHVVPNGIERPAFPPRDEVRSRLGISPREVVIGFVGRLTPQKAPDLLIDAFAMAFAQRADVRLLMVGSGPLESEVRRRVEQRGLSSSRVTLLGDVVGTTIMPAFDVFCLSSRYEGMPYVYLEALAAGLPIVSTRVCGAITCVEPKRNGLIVPPGDAHALSDALATLSADAALRRRYGAASETLAAQFTASQMVDQTLRVYSRVLMDKFDASRMPVIFPWSRFEGRKRGSRQTGVAPPHR